MSLKHPHGRGEDLLNSTPLPSITETPPRAWGRPHASLGNIVNVGNTPTGVGKTLHAWAELGGGRKHPHGRGEDTPVRE